MSLVFLSYAHEDADRIAPLVRLLETAGSVWWDPRIRHGGRWDTEIETALARARCVVVVWSARSVGSTWVREEASVGLERGVLVPVLIDDVRPPLGFRQIEAARLHAWDGSPDHPEARMLLESVAALLSAGAEAGAGPESPPVAGEPPPAPPPPARRLPGSRRARAAALALVLLAGVLAAYFAGLLPPRPRGDGVRSNTAAPDTARRGADAPPRGYAALPAQLRIRSQPVGDRVELSYSWSGASTATTREFRDTVPRASLQAIAGRRGWDDWASAGSAQRLSQRGDSLERLLLPAALRDLLRSAVASHLVVVHDQPSGTVPWEVVLHEQTLGAGLSRGFSTGAAADQPWDDPWRPGQTLRVLLIVNPTGDLPGAAREGEVLRAQLERAPDVHIRVLEGGEATKSSVRSALRGGGYNIVHYAGHASFVDARPSASGLVLAGQEILTAADLSGLGRLPELVFVNAAFAAQVPLSPEARGATGIAEAYLRAGVPNFIGPWSIVDDQTALLFAREFYAALLAGQPTGRAVVTARRKVWERGRAEALDYLHYGSAGFGLR